MSVTSQVMPTDCCLLQFNQKEELISSFGNSNIYIKFIQNHDIMIANRCFQNVAQFRHLGTTITNQNLIQEEIKRRSNSGNACYRSVQNL
jgi:hypothetical protein